MQPFFKHQPGNERATDHINNIALCPLAGSSVEPSLSITQHSKRVATTVTVARYNCVSRTFICPLWEKRSGFKSAPITGD